MEPSRARVKQILDSHKIPFRESHSILRQPHAGVIYELGNEKDSVYQIWKDEKCTTHILSSADTIKAFACWRTFEARGKGITWGILDTGIRSDLLISSSSPPSISNSATTS